MSGDTQDHPAPVLLHPAPAEMPFLSPGEPGELGRLGPYRVLGVLGEGGMGVVLRAENAITGQAVAVKVMRPRVATPEARARFLREARSAAAVEHPRVVPVLHADEADTPAGLVPFLAMPLLKGESLESHLRATPRPPLAEAVRFGREMAEGLAAAHAAGLVHRDVKPANVWLRDPPTPGEPRQALLLDFGLARAADADSQVTEPGAVIGTPAYMAPEQARGEAVDGRADLFALGCVLYRMLTGEPPFRGPTLHAVLLALATETPASSASLNPAVPPALSDLVDRLMAKDPAGRPASAEEVAAALLEIERSLPAAGSPPPSTPRAANPPAAPPTPPPTPSGVGWQRIALIGVFVAGAAVTLPRLHCNIRIDDPKPAADPTAAGGLTGTIHLRVWDAAANRPIALRPNEPGVLPLKAGDRVRVAARLSRPEYPYLIRVETTGKVVPLYPWTRGEWGTRPSAEERRDHVELPDAGGGTLPVGGGPAGMETYALLARETPLPADGEEALREALAALGPQRWQAPQSAVWFDDGLPVTGRDDPDRRPAAFDPARAGDPVMKVQQVLTGALARWFPLTWSVSFASKGG